jgi:hypothetical protein
MVVSVVVGLRYMSISILSGCRISSRPRKHKLLLFSCDCVNCRLGCVLLMCWWIVWGVVYFVFYIISISTYLV